MALSKQITPTSTLDGYLAWAVSQGYHVGENPRYGTKTVTKGVHAAGSFHYDGLASDINAGANGAAERAKLLVALDEAVRRGLAVTFARDGVVGSAANHKNHLHVDVGEWSNLGKGLVRRTPAVTGAGGANGSVTWLGSDDGVLVLGSQGDRVHALQTRLNRDYPAYSNLAADGDYGHATVAVVKEFQRRAGLFVDGEAGPRTLAKLGL